MCGYVRRHIPNKILREFMELLQQPGLFPEEGGEDLIHYYPAFGKDPSKTIDIIIRDEGQLRRVNATWWFDCAEQDCKLVVGDRTTFNARNLDSPYWKSAIRSRRAIIVCTGLGESKIIDGKKHQYLMTSDRPIFIGAVYRKFPGDLYSCALITRDSHPRFDAYHDKAFPLFLPYDNRFLELWLSGVREDHPAIASLLDQPKLFPTLEVQEVKSFKKGSKIGRSLLLSADDVLGSSPGSTHPMPQQSLF
jgi:putative SOS response-associated peptidase YedK